MLVLLLSVSANDSGKVSLKLLVLKLRPYYKTGRTRSWDFLGLDYYQPSASGLLQKAKYGEDVIIGVVDTGIWPESRSFDDSGYGPVPARWKGSCQAGEAFNATSCNRKIVGARWYTGDVDRELLKGEYMSARDLNGHGTHVASTIAGGPVRNVSYGGLAPGVARGGAPRARLAAYKVCWGSGLCGDAAILAAIDDAINDGVDILSLSLSGAEETPGTLHAVARGIFVVFIAGNNGPAAQTVQNAVPWILTVAASTIDRSFPTVVSLGNNEKLVGQSLYFNSQANSSGFNMLIDAQRSSGNFLDALDFCRGIMPCVLVDFEIANRIASYAANARFPVVRISPAVSVVGNGVLSPRVAAFSSRGPSYAFPGIVKNDDCETYMGQLYQLNLPSIAVPNLKDSITVWRTVTNVGPVNAAYRVVVEAPAGVDVTVNPSVITFNSSGGKKATFQVTFTARQRVQGGYTFGSLKWLGGGIHSVRIPVAVRTVINDFIADIYHKFDHA
ncbi:Subtilisin-like protease SBT3.5 [Dichanthelium oligosanthes]|uniref:Subtilisin-like protease SBT3.5 n=1 Tax=Dichanthelium oligosanthes TaxID=888268 RepID=A0A1E5USX7_9POAL|nr:Subtilisin-like protease SBT3.5 [Dichanthelium oligosanthes]